MLEHTGVFEMTVPTVTCMKGKCLTVIHIMFCAVRPPRWLDLLLLLPVVYCRNSSELCSFLLFKLILILIKSDWEIVCEGAECVTGRQSMFGALKPQRQKKKMQ